ncbi:hypothetical protein [Lachnobacterium bovis]|uniref:hypothetical protein n=1 Tax=Lachnobacterium bovis TaxID=140626 RepID=UPI0012DDEF1B|nr:hypothetical protein [Lachnobacterium bovis]
MNNLTYSLLMDKKDPKVYADSPEGSSISGLEGRVGTQGMGFYGGAHQVYLDYRAVPSDWIEITPTNEIFIGYYKSEVR